MHRILLFSVASLFLLSACHDQHKETAHETQKPPQKTDTSAVTPVDENQQTDSVSFHVSDVVPASYLLNTDSSYRVFSNKLSYQILYMPAEHRHQKLIGTYNNAFLQTLQFCYNDHRPLTLSPDVLWLTICQGVSIHINQHFATLKSSLLKKGKPDRLVVRNDSLQFGEHAWQALIDSISEQADVYTTNNARLFFSGGFSTSGPVEKTAYNICMLESYKKGFQYVGESGCGIPVIKLKGNKADWQNLYNRLQLLEQFGMKDWADDLRPVILEFIKVYEGSPDPVFWQSIYKSISEYNNFFISGWCLKLFPYIKKMEPDGDYDETTGTSKYKETFVPNPFVHRDSYCLSNLSTDNIPGGISKIDITWNDYFKNRSMNIEACSGFMGIRQYADKSLEPVISWAICDKSKAAESFPFKGQKYRKQTHKMEYWSPRFPKTLTNQAVYDIKQFKTHEASMAYLKALIEDSLKQRAEYKNTNLQKIKLSFIVYSNGHIDSVSTGRTDVPGLNHSIENILDHLPQPWFPALAHPTDVLWLMDMTEEEAKIKMRVNSRVRITLF